MLQAIGVVLPIALAVAISSVPIMATIVMLLSPKGGQTALPFLIGWVLGMATMVTLFTVGAQVVPSPRLDRRPDTVIAIIEILVGIALIVLADHRMATCQAASEGRPAEVAGVGRQAGPVERVRHRVRAQRSAEGPAARDRGGARHPRSRSLAGPRLRS